jgi:pilus assembly protein CpaB
MKPKTVIPLVIGLGVGFFAIKMGFDMVQKAKGSSGDTRSVVVASSTIGVATRITDSMLSTKEVPDALVPSGAYTDLKSLVGRVSKLTIPAGVPINPIMLAPAGSEPGLRALIPPGFRAVSVKVNEASSVAGFVMPGARVDVFAGEAKGKAANHSRLILSDVEIGAVGQSLNEVASDGKTVRVTKSVTLFVRPEQVPVLHAASNKGLIQLAMRGDGESNTDNFLTRLLSRATAESADQNEPEPQPVLQPEPVKVAVADKRHVVEVLQGAKLERIVFDDHGRVVQRFDASAPNSRYGNDDNSSNGSESGSNNNAPSNAENNK